MKTRLVAIILFFSTLSLAQTGTPVSYDIKFQIKNCNDTMMYLVGNLFGRQHVSDTCRKVKNGLCQFKGKRSLDKGVYTLVSQEKTTYFDFLIDDSYKFTVSFDRNDIVNTLKSSGSKENEDMFAYLKFMTNKSIDFNKVRESAAKMSKKDSAKFVLDKYTTMTADVTKFEEPFMKKVNGTFVFDFLNMKAEKEAKEVPKASNGRPDSLWRYYYYKNHFWDGVDFKDKRIVSIPFFYDRVKRYFDGVIFQYSPDSVIKEIDWILSKCTQDSLVYNLLFGHFMYKYEQDKRMSFDKIFVHMSDNYISKGKANGVYTDESIKIIEKRVAIVRNLLIDAKASELYMIDTVDAPKVLKMGFDTIKTSKGATDLYYNNLDKLTPWFKTLYMTNAKFTVLVFWDVDCSHCQTEIPKLHEELAKIKGKIDYKVFSVYTKEDYQKWRKYIIDKKLNLFYHVFDPIHLNDIKNKYDINSTPVIYVLDKDKRIKAKKLSADQIGNVLEYLDSIEKTPAKK
jgi:thiol-disulfide isomerase/thioredoxin